MSRTAPSECVQCADVLLCMAEVLKTERHLSERLRNELENEREDRRAAEQSRDEMEANVRERIARDIEERIPDITFHDGRFTTATDEARMRVKQQAAAIARSLGGVA